MFEYYTLFSFLFALLFSSLFFSSFASLLFYYFVSYHIIILYDQITLHNFILYYITSYHHMSYLVILYYDRLHYITSYYIMFYHIALYYTLNWRSRCPSCPWLLGCCRLFADGNYQNGSCNRHPTGRHFLVRFCKALATPLESNIVSRNLQNAFFSNRFSRSLFG